MRLVPLPARVEYLGPVSDAPLLLRLTGYRVCAGFPSPADDWIEAEIDLAKVLIVNPLATFLYRVAGASVREAGIPDGSIVVVDRSREPKDGEVVLVTVNGEQSLKVFRKPGRLEFANAAMPAWPMHEADVIEIVGVVAYCICEPGA